MFKGCAKKKNGDPIIVLGITEVNVQKLKEGKPLLVDLAELGGKGEILIHYGKDMREVILQLTPVLPDDVVTAALLNLDEAGEIKKPSEH